MNTLSEELKAEGWVPGFPSYRGDSWEGFEIKYVHGVAWHRVDSTKAQLGM